MSEMIEMGAIGRRASGDAGDENAVEEFRRKSSGDTPALAECLRASVKSFSPSVVRNTTPDGNAADASFASEEIKKARASSLDTVALGENASMGPPGDLDAVKGVGEDLPEGPGASYHLDHSPSEADRHPSKPPFHISLGTGVILVILAILSASGFPHLALMNPYSADPIEKQGVVTYRNTLGGAGETTYTKWISELSMLTHMTALMYVVPDRTPYNVAEDPTNATWDIGLHKWFLGEAKLHPERRFCYVDAGSWSWTCQDIRGSPETRLVGNASSFSASLYNRNTTGGSLPLRYTYVGQQDMPVNPVETAVKFLTETNDMVWLLKPFLDYTGNISYAFNIRLLSATVGLQGVFIMFIPVEEFIVANQFLYRQEVISCEASGCSATFDPLGGLVTTNVPSVSSVYVDVGTPGAQCFNNALLPYKRRCRHSRETMARVWPQLGQVLSGRPEVLTADWVAFQFQTSDGSYYLSTSGTFNISYEPWLSIVISPADNIYGAYYESRFLVIYTVVGTFLGACLLAVVITQYGLSHLTTALDDMTSALALRSRKDKKGEFAIRREARASDWFAFGEIKVLDSAIVSLEHNIDRLAAMLPPAVIAAMRNGVARKRRQQRREEREKWGPLACLCASSTPNSLESDMSEMVQEEDANSPDELSPNASFTDDGELATLRLGHLSANILGLEAAVDSDEASYVPLESETAHQLGDDLEFALNPDLPQPSEADATGINVLAADGAPTPGAVDETPGRPASPQGILVPSSIGSLRNRRRGVFGSILLTRVACQTTAAFQQMIATLIQCVWNHKGEFECVTLNNFVFSFGCYEEIRDPEAAACGCALQIMKLFPKWCADTGGAMSGRILIVIDAGRFEDVTVETRVGPKRKLRNRVITTAARYGAEHLNVLCDALNEPLVVTEEVKKKLTKIVTSVIDNVRFSPTCMPRLSRRGDVRLYRVELRNAAMPVTTLRYMKSAFCDAFCAFMAGDFETMKSALKTAHMQYKIFDHSKAARRFWWYCELMIANNRGRPGTPVKGGKHRTVYYRSEMQEWELHDCEAEVYRKIWNAADAATARQHFGLELQTL